MLNKIKMYIRGIMDDNQWHKVYGPKAPKAGEPAPDFELSDVQGKNPMRLSEQLGKRPIILVFGSFT